MRRGFLVAPMALLILSGCTGAGSSTGGTGAERVDTMDMTLDSPAFGHGEEIPDRYGYTNENLSPPLTINEVPDEAESLILIMDDPDAMEPAGKIWDHWVLFNVPPGTTSIPENTVPDGAVEGTTDYGEVGYGGPNPPDGEHTYRFRLYALDTTLDLERGASAEAVEDAMDGHVLAETTLKGTYAPD